MLKILMGGSPCTRWSIAQTSNREATPDGLGWELFENYHVAKEKFKPDFFLYENNKSAAQPIKDQISRELGVPIMHINSALVSAQNRQRFYAFNWEVEQPEDRGILLRDILESGVVDREKSYPLLVSHQGNARDYFKKQHAQIVFEPVDGQGDKTGLYACSANGKQKPIYEIADGVIAIKGKQYPIKLEDGYYIIRKLTVKECCRLQTLPDDYCQSVSNSQAYKGLGNGWTAEVIIHILNGALAKVPKDEEIVVLSMYDGIGTGRYCLDKMGFTNVRYYAYEIDKYAKEVSMSNYPDIIQLGDAFDVRRSDWSLPAT